MLEVTQQAFDVIRGIVAEEGADEALGLRVTVDGGDTDDPGLNIDVTDGPEAGDETIAKDGVRVYLDEQASELLNDKRLDVHAHGDHFHFTIDDQGAPPSTHDHHDH
jgi:iron-sulfur cluster assembly protein